MTSDSLAHQYDLAMFDLDGVVYIGPDAVPGAAEAIATARADGLRVAFITNNASRPSSAVARHLTELGVPCEVGDVVTSAQAAAGLAAERWGEGASVVALGAEGLISALSEAGLVPVGVDDDAVGLVSGYGPELRWREIMQAAVRVRDGLAWIACNTDTSIPTAFGSAPGHGVLVEMLRSFTGVDPDVAGKPSPPLLEETMRRVGGERPLMVGDRLDTDIEGAAAVGIDSLLVLTGVTGLADLVAAPPAQRPTHISPDLSGLLSAPSASVERDGWWHAGEHRARVVDGRLDVDPAGHDDPDWWNAACAAAWAHLDSTGTPALADDPR